MKTYNGLKVEKINLPDSADMTAKSGCWAMVAYTQPLPENDCYETQNPEGDWVGLWISAPPFD